MPSAREGLYLLVLFCCCYSINYFEEQRRLLTALVSLLFILPRLACFYAPGKAYENVAFAVNSLTSIGGLLAWKVLVVRSIGHSPVTLVVAVLARLMLVVLQWCGPKKGPIDWTFVLLAALHGCLVSDLIRMASFFSVVPTAHETIACILLFALVLAGNVVGILGRGRSLRIRMAYTFLLLACYGIAVDRIRTFRHSFQADRYLSTKDNILAMLMLRKKFDGHVEYEQLMASSQSFRQEALVQFIWKMLRDHRWTGTLEDLCRWGIGHTYPVLLDTDVIRKILRVQPGDLEQSTMFNMQDFALYANRRAEKKLLKAQAWSLAAQYYSAMQWLLLVAVVLALACSAWHGLLEVPFWLAIAWLGKTRLVGYLKGRWTAFCGVMSRTFFDPIIEEESKGGKAGQEVAVGIEGIDAEGIEADEMEADEMETEQDILKEKTL